MSETSPHPVVRDSAAVPLAGMSRGWRGAALLVLVAAGALFVVRGPMRAVEGGGDFMVLYAAARAWLTGANPYDYADLEQTLRAAGYARASLPDATNRPALYPPPTFVVLAPLAALPWTAALWAWLAVNLAAVPLLVHATVRLAQLTWRSPAAWLTAAAVLAMASLHTAVALGQLVLVPTLLVLTAAWRMAPRERRAGAAAGAWIDGSLIALATAIKPHVGGVGLIYLLCRGRWRGLVVAGGGLALLGALGAGALAWRGEPWLAMQAQNMQRFLHGGAGDPTLDGPYRYHLFNLHVPLHAIIDSRAVVSGLVLLLAVMTGLATWGVAVRRATAEGGRGAHLLLASLAVLSLWAVTHRHYDAVLLVIPLAWAVSELTRPAGAGTARRWAWATLVCLTPFLAPGGAMVYVLAQWWGLSEAVVASWPWQMFVVPHQTWALLAVQVCLLKVLWQPRPQVGPSPGLH